MLLIIKSIQKDTKQPNSSQSIICISVYFLDAIIEYSYFPYSSMENLPLGRSCTHTVIRVKSNNCHRA